MYLELLCLLKQNTVVATKPHHVRLCWMEILAQTTSGLCTPVPFLLHVHLHWCVYMCTYPCVCAERKTASITAIFTLCGLLLRSFLNNFLHAMALGFSEEPCPVFSSKTCPYDREQARQNCQWFSLDFPITTYPLLHSLAALFQSKSLWFSLKPTLESSRHGEMELYLSWNGRVFSDAKPELLLQFH